MEINSADRVEKTDVRALMTSVNELRAMHEYRQTKDKGSESYFRAT